ncbi:hypothetical protein [Gordonia sihwensis]|uniref:hypothetical protein n=1 Tax=Gordonia sihwensis TaxID=173559 RepID=UPI003D96FA93
MTALTDLESELPAELATLRSVAPTPVADGVWCIKTRDDGQYCIDVIAMLLNYRVVLSPTADEHLTYDAGWCYFGHGHADSGVTRTMKSAAVAAVLAAAAWDGYGEPAGYDKRI